MRLLTEEQIKEYSLKAMRDCNDLQQTTEGHFKQEDIDAIYMERDRAMLQKQAEIAKEDTLKAVKELLDKGSFRRSI